MSISSVSSASALQPITSPAQTSQGEAAQVSAANPEQSQVATQALTSTPAASPISPVPMQITGSALLGGTGAGASILAASESDDTSSLFGGFASQNSNLITQIEATVNGRLQDELDQINEAAAQATAIVDDQNQRWISVKSEINNAQIAVSNAQDSVGKISDTLLDMRTSIANTGEKGEDPKYWKDQFDQQLNVINIQAESAEPSDNLIGNINPIDGTPSTVDYRSDITGATTTLNGTYVGSTFTITTASGEQWRLDNQTDILQAYNEGGSNAETYKTSSGDTLAKATSTHTGLKLISYDPDTQNITVDVSVDPDDKPIRVTGKMDISGIGLMGSWFYNNFATQADRNRAFSDIDKAEVNIVSSQATLQMAASQTADDQKHADGELDLLSAQTVKINQDQQDKTQAAQSAAAQQFLGIQANLQNLTAMQNNYLGVFGDSIGDPLTQAALDMNA